jgi:hypothetical protein
MPASAVARTLMLLAAAGAATWAADRFGATRRARDHEEALRAVQARPHLLFRSQRGGDAFGRVAIVPLDRPAAPPVLTDLRCDRVHFAAGRGLCLVDRRGLGDAMPLYATSFGADFRPGPRRRLPGPPSRARVSPDGRRAAVTAFVAGESYACDFATRTSVVDLERGAPAADLETFTVRSGGAIVQSPDFNFWGVTFARGDDRFYATLATAGRKHLVLGDATRRTIEILSGDGELECPSLSPDGARIAYKKPLAQKGRWRLHVLDLRTGREHAIAGEARSIDDQPEWLDAGRVLYGHLEEAGFPETAANIWVADVDGDAPARVFVRGALSPAVVRP